MKKGPKPTLVCRNGHLRSLYGVRPDGSCRWCSKAQFIKKYGLSLSDYEVLLNKQHGVCAICGKTDKTYLAVDHDHRCCSGKASCGKCVRGLLCCHCNAALSRSKDSIEILTKCIDYLKSHSAIVQENQQ